MMCIYNYRNVRTNDRYIGSTIDSKRRQSTHLRLLKRSKHHSRYLQNAFNAYGEQSFTFEVLEIINDVRIILDREVFWTKSLNPVYNTLKDIKSHIGAKRSKEFCKRMSEARKGIPRPPEVIEKVRKALTGKRHTAETKLKRSKHHEVPILQIDVTTGVITEWKSATEAAKTLNIRKQGIYYALWKISKSYKQNYWKYNHGNQENKTCSGGGCSKNSSC